LRHGIFFCLLSSIFDFSNNKQLRLNKIPVLLLLVLLRVAALAQPIHTLSNDPAAQISDYAVLPDQGYNFNTILSDTTLPFKVNDSLRPRQATGYWLKIKIANPFHEALPYNLQILPALNNTLYYFDANARKWVSAEAGVMTRPGNSRVNRNGMACILRAQTLNTIYVHVDVTPLRQTSYVLQPSLRLEKGAAASKQEQMIWITWIASLTVVFLFFLNNVYVWFSFKDKTVLYYLIGQLGGMVYITAYKKVFPVLFPCPVFSIGLQRNGSPGTFGLNDLLLHLSILVVMYSMVQFTRSYLNTRQSLPRLDAALKYGLYAYLPLSFIFVILNCGLIYTERYYWLVDNIFPMFLFATIIYSGVLGYKRRLPAAPVFLLANIVSVGFMLALPLYHLIMDLNDMKYSVVKSLLPDLISITQTFGFSVALVARTRSIQRDLAAKEMEAVRLETDLQEIERRHQLIELENQQIKAGILNEKTRNEQLKERLETNQRELASSTLYIAQKNELLAGLKTQIKELKKFFPDSKHQGLQDIESTLQNSQYLDADWSKFKLHFEQVHPVFFENLQANHPNLTKNEVRLCAYFHINLSTKEIATLLNIDPASVRRAKTRLYKKMGVNNGNKSTDEEE
jgi:DNA-binding CsgD family transcriptional regulator